MGVYLREGLLLFTLGKLYKIEGRNSYAITQFVWDDEFDYFKKRYVTKIEERCFDKLVGDLVISGVAKVD
jgi:hypothetical protein